jgi:uncharacterized protein
VEPPADFPDHPAGSGGRPAPGDPAAGRQPAGGAARRGAALLEVLLCSGYPTQLLVVAVLRLLGFHPLEPDGRLSLGFVTALSLLDAGLLVGLIVFFLRAQGERPRDVFLGRRPAGGEVILGLQLIPVVFLFVLVLLLLIRALAPWLHDVPDNPLEAMLRTAADAWIFGVVVVIAGGVREELQRAFILHRFEQHLGGAWVGLVLFSVAFGLGHIDQGRDAVIATAALGAFWGVVYLWRRSVVAPMVSHAGFNLVEVIRHVFMRGATFA